MQIPLIDFSITALARFAPLPDAAVETRIVEVDLSSLDDAVERIAPSMYIPAPVGICPEGGLTVTIKKLSDFKPENIIKNSNYLSALKDASKFASEAAAGGLEREQIGEQIKTKWPNLPLDYSKAAEAAGSRTSSKVDDILSLVAMPSETSRPDSKQAKNIKQQLDDILGDLLVCIFSNQEFRTCESAWRGLESLLKQGRIKEGQGAVLKIVNTSPQALESTLQSLSVKLAENLPNLVLIDLPMDNSPRGVEQMESVLDFADTLLTPTVCYITSDFFYLKNWTELGKITYIKHHLEDALYAKWRKLSEHPGAAWTAVSANRFLTRFPYGMQHKPKGVYFEEPGPLWISPVWAFGALTAQSAVSAGWPSRFTDYRKFTLSELTVFNPEGGEPCATETSLSEDRLLEFIDAGITPLLGPIRKDSAFIPKESTLSGGSLRFQLFFSRLLGFLFWAKDNLDAAVREGDIALNVQSAIAMFWEKTGRGAPADLAVKVVPSDGDDVILSISLTPPAEVLPGGRLLEFTFSW